MHNYCQFHDITPIFWILCHQKCLKKSNLFTVIFSLFLGFFLMYNMWLFNTKFICRNKIFTKARCDYIIKCMIKSIYWELKYSNFYLFFGPSCDLVFISKPIPTKYIIKTAGVQVESRWSPWKGEKYCVKWCGMGWNPWTPHGVRGVHQEYRWNPGGMTRNLWGSVKSSLLGPTWPLKADSGEYYWLLLYE